MAHKNQKTAFDDIQAVLVIRNPFSALLAYFQYSKTKGHVGTVDFNSETGRAELREFALKWIVTWEEFVKQWVVRR